ncbi:MAG TPA: DUF177 domain-containing protein [Vicinamibacterales bacterium]|nr:DUF177 domain-containing protein [Vicinamibacterales bacterium]
MLVLNLARIRTPHEHFDQVYPAETFAADQENFTVVSPVTLGLDVHKDKDHFRLEGRVETLIELPCSRCLEPFRWPVNSIFDLRYQPRQAASASEREIEEDDFSSAFYENDEIDLVQMMREQFYLSLPMKPLCRPDCRGLCPQCGTNLNRGTCDCKIAWDDPRFAALKSLNVKSQEPGTRN